MNACLPVACYFMNMNLQNAMRAVSICLMTCEYACQEDGLQLLWNFLEVES